MTNGLAWRHSNHPDPQLALGFTLGAMHPMGLDKCIMIGIAHLKVKESHCPLSPLCFVF